MMERIISLPRSFAGRKESLLEGKHSGSLEDAGRVLSERKLHQKNEGSAKSTKIEALELKICVKRYWSVYLQHRCD